MVADRFGSVGSCGQVLSEQVCATGYGCWQRSGHSNPYPYQSDFQWCQNPQGVKRQCPASRAISCAGDCIWVPEYRNDSGAWVSRRVHNVEIPSLLLACWRWQADNIPFPVLMPDDKWASGLSRRPLACKARFVRLFEKIIGRR